MSLSDAIQFAALILACLSAVATLFGMIVKWVVRAELTQMRLDVREEFRTVKGCDAIRHECPKRQPTRHYLDEDGN
jgi:hypothetical protein